MPMLFWIDPRLLAQLDQYEIRALQKFRMLTAMSETLGEDAYDAFLRTCNGMLDDAFQRRGLFVEIVQGIIENLEDMKVAEVRDEEDESP